jgi:PadR family transcriptional regulator PadR
MDLSAWQSQLRKGAAEMVVLACLDRGERYGLQILEAVGGLDGIVSEGSLYPLLNRLEREGKLVARWSLDDPASAHPRKYYRLSSDGAALLAAMRPAWTEFKAAISSILEDPA